MSNLETANTTSTEMAELQAKDLLKAIEKKLEEDEKQALIQLGNAFCLRLKLLGLDNACEARRAAYHFVDALRQVWESVEWNPAGTKHRVHFNENFNPLPEVIRAIFVVDAPADEKFNFLVSLP